MALEPAEARLLMPYVLGLAGDFDNPGVQSAATSLFTVQPLTPLPMLPRSKHLRMLL